MLRTLSFQFHIPFNSERHPKVVESIDVRRQQLRPGPDTVWLILRRYRETSPFNASNSYSSQERSPDQSERGQKQNFNAHWIHHLLYSSWLAGQRSCQANHDLEELQL